MIEISKEPTPEVIDLLSRAIIGTPGKGITYRLSEVKRKIYHLGTPLFLTIKKQSKLVATCCLCKRTEFFEGKALDSYYIRYFAFSEVYRKGSSTSKVRKNSGGILKNNVKMILAGSSFYNSPATIPHFFYAYVDTDNYRSLGLSNLFGFEVLRSFSTVVYSRWKPVADSRVSKYLSSDKQAIIDNLRAFYSNYTMFSFDNVFFDDSYFVLRKNGSIVAGAQANLVHWEITGFPGFFGRFALQVLPHIPFLNRYFSRDFRYISFEAVFYKDGCEKDLEKLFDAVLALYKLNTGILWLDNASGLYRSIKNLKRGFFGSFFRSKPVSIIARFNGMPIEAQNKLKNLPAYISAFDLT